MSPSASTAISCDNEQSIETQLTAADLESLFTPLATAKDEITRVKTVSDVET